MKTYWGSGRRTSHILNLSIRERRVVGFKPWPPYPQHPLDRRLAGPQRWSGCGGKEKKNPCSHSIL